MNSYNNYYFVSKKVIKSIIKENVILKFMVFLLKTYLLSILQIGNIPEHISLILDGNRTYAKINHMPIEEGHKSGTQTLLNILEYSYKLGIKEVSIYAFSIENFKRTTQEVETLLNLLREKLKILLNSKELKDNQNQIKIKILGNKSYLPPDLLKDLELFEERSKNFQSNKCLNICLAYTSRDDIMNSIKKNIMNFKQNQIKSLDEITETVLQNNMYFGSETPELNILVRTSGKTRLSDFMLWQCTNNCYIAFVKKLWPDFKFLTFWYVIICWKYLIYRNGQVFVVKKNSDKNKIGYNELRKQPSFLRVCNEK